MRKTREILRLKWLLERSHRETARSLGVGTGTVALTVHRAGQVGLDWSQVQALSDEALEERLYGERAERQSARPRPDCVYIHTVNDLSKARKTDPDKRGWSRITGATGTGKTYLACALAQQACRKGYRAIYRRTSRLFDELLLARPTAHTFGCSTGSSVWTSS